MLQNMKCTKLVVMYQLSVHTLVVNFYWVICHFIRYKIKELFCYKKMMAPKIIDMHNFTLPDSRHPHMCMISKCTLVNDYDTKY